VDQHTTNKADKAKRRKTRELIEQELYTYEQSRREIQRRIAEIDDIASPRSNWPPIGRVPGANEKGDVVAFVEGRGEGQTSDPTASRAQKVSDYKEHVLGGKVFQEMRERVEAIEKVLDGWRTHKKRGAGYFEYLGAASKLHIVRRKYFDQADDETIWRELRISRTTFYRYRMAIIKEIAKELGWQV